jgi:hypothetical protein
LPFHHSWCVRAISCARRSSGKRLHQVPRFRQQLGDADRLGRQIQVAGVQLRDLQQFVDQPQEMASALEHLAQAVALVLVERRHVEHLAEAEDGVEGRAQFVVHRREKLASRRQRLAGLAAGLLERRVARREIGAKFLDQRAIMVGAKRRFNAAGVGRQPPGEGKAGRGLGAIRHSLSNRRNEQGT